MAYIYICYIQGDLSLVCFIYIKHGQIKVVKIVFFEDGIIFGHSGRKTINANVLVIQRIICYEGA